MTHRKKLKATLQSQQSRLRAKQKAEHAAQIAARKGKPSKDKLPPTMPFEPMDKLLLLGEGNFSFAHALVVDAPSALAHMPPANVTATSYDSEEACYAKYPDARAIVRTVAERGVEVLFGVDATRLQKHPALRGRRWDRIVWNFPHAGKGIADQDRNILSNQRLILDFLRSAQHCLTLGPIPVVYPTCKRKRQDDDDDDDEPHDASGSDVDIPTSAATARGTVLITLRNVPPYTEWDVPRLAKSPPNPMKTGDEPNPRYKLLRSFAFHRTMWKGYEHRMTKGERAHGHGRPGGGGEDRTWEFCLQEP